MGQAGQFKILSDDQIEQIHQSALSILWKTGVEVREDQAFEVLRKAGCPTNGKRVRIPSSLVKETVRLAPKAFMLHGRDPEFKVNLEGRRVCYEPMIGRLNILDLDTGERRRTTLDDVEKLIRVADALEHYTLLHSGAGGCRRGRRPPAPVFFSDGQRVASQRPDTGCPRVRAAGAPAPAAPRSSPR